MLDELSAEAAAVGSVNTVTIREGRLTGYNTDCSGFRMSFEAGMADAPREDVLLLGAGGAGAAVAQALLDAGAARILIHDADASRSQALAARLGELIAAAPLAIATVIVGSVAYLTRILRAGMIEALASDFVERLRLAGIPEMRIVFVHALPAAVVPALTAAALYAAALVSGIVVVELVFVYPGIGQEMVRAVTMREIPVIQAIAILAALVVVCANLFADLAMLALDPRRRG